jgi:hypothetical protein
MHEREPYSGSNGELQRLPLKHLDQLICIALARPAVAQQLLEDPPAALESVSNLVQLSTFERELLLSVQGATDLYDLADRLHELIQAVLWDTQV